MLIVIGVATPLFRTVSLKVMTGRLAFVAFAGTTAGTRNSIPDSASKASIVPELNLLKYIEDVFIIFMAGRSKSVYKQSGRIV